MSNYLRVTDADYERALTNDSALQNALQQPAVLPRTGSQPEMANPGKPAEYKALRESAARGERAVSGSVVPTGFEPGDVTHSQPTDLRQTPNQRAAECAAVGDDLPPIDPDLASVTDYIPYRRLNRLSTRIQHRLIPSLLILFHHSLLLLICHLSYPIYLELHACNKCQPVISGRCLRIGASS